MSEARQPLTVRMSDDLYRRFFERCRVEERKSMNRVIIELVEAYLEDDDSPGAEPADEPFV